MASFYLRTRTGLASKGAGGKHAAYVAGEEKYSDKAEVKAVIDKNLPAFAKNGKDFFKHADQLERANGRSYRSVVFAIPREAQDPTKWAQGFTDALLKDRHAYRLAIHIDPENHNPHAHLVFCERGRREGAVPKDYFTRQNPKDAALKSKYWLKSSKALYLKHIRQLCPTYTPPMTGEQKIGQTLKHAGKTYEAKRKQRERQVIELRASFEDVGILDKQEQETKRAIAKKAGDDRIALFRALEPTKATQA